MLDPPAAAEAHRSRWHSRHADRWQLVRLAVGLTGDRDAAEEIVQKAFAALLGRWRFLREVSAAQAYLQRGGESSPGRWRARRRTQVVAAVLPGRREQTDGPDVDAQLDVLTALGQLPWSKRACVLLCYYADLSEAQTAAVLGISVGTVKSQTAKGTRRVMAAVAAAAAVVLVVGHGVAAARVFGASPEPSAISRAHPPRYYVQQSYPGTGGPPKPVVVRATATGVTATVSRPQPGTQIPPQGIATTSNRHLTNSRPHRRPPIFSSSTPRPGHVRYGMAARKCSARVTSRSPTTGAGWSSSAQRAAPGETLRV